PFTRQPEGLRGAEGKETGEVEILRAAGEELRVAVVEQLAEAETGGVDHGPVDRVAGDGARGGHDRAGAAEAGDGHQRRLRMRADFGGFEVFHEGQNVVRALGEEGMVVAQGVAGELALVWHGAGL